MGWCWRGSRSRWPSQLSSFRENNAMQYSFVFGFIVDNVMNTSLLFIRITGQNLDP